MKVADPKIALVTGVNGGIGAAVCAQLAADGMELITVARSDSSAVSRSHYVLDLSDGKQIDRLANIDKVDVVVHTASSCPSSPLLDASVDQFDSTYQLNVLCPLRLLQLLAPKMQSRKQGGSFVFISSINGARACPNLAAYSASKAALHSLTQTAAEELAPSGIRVNAVAPASVDTPMLNASFDRQSDPVAAKAKNVLRHPLGRLGTPEDVANMVSFLASDKSDWITGGIHFVDGGAHITRR